MEKVERLTKAAHWAENVNTVTMFVLPPLTAIYAVWSGDWRAFQSALVIGITVFVFGIAVYSAKERAEKSAKRS